MKATIYFELTWLILLLLKSISQHCRFFSVVGTHLEEVLSSSSESMGYDISNGDWGV